MSIIDHGTWSQYQPSEARKDAPANAVFSRRDSDGVDWYEYVHPGTNFRPDSVKLVVRKDDDGRTVIQAPTMDATALFPQSGWRVVELTGGDYRALSVDALIARLANKVIDLKTGEVRDGRA
jgi:hypothetical protein